MGGGAGRPGPLALPSRLEPLVSPLSAVTQLRASQCASPSSLSLSSFCLVLCLGPCHLCPPALICAFKLACWLGAQPNVESVNKCGSSFVSVSLLFSSVSLPSSHCPWLLCLSSFHASSILLPQSLSLTVLLSLCSQPVFLCFCISKSLFCLFCLILICSFFISRSFILTFTLSPSPCLSFLKALGKPAPP